jgi:zinc finger protein
MCQTSVPYFTDLIIMSFKCEYCGAHSTETKNSGEITENACVITLKAEGDDDLKRDLFKVLFNFKLRAKHVVSTFLI